jgi:hypothetical protein
MVEDELSVLLRQLDEAFGHLPIPPAGRLVSGNCACDLEAQEIMVKFRGRHWRDLNSADLFGEADSLSFFTPEAFRFFLPAFIRVSLLDTKNADLIDAILWNLTQPDDSKIWEDRKDLYLETARTYSIPESVVLELIPKKDPELDAFCKERIAVLADDQRQAVINFIQFTRRYGLSGKFVARHLDRAEYALRELLGRPPEMVLLDRRSGQHPLEPCPRIFEGGNKPRGPRDYSQTLFHEIGHGCGVGAEERNWWKEVQTICTGWPL